MLARCIQMARLNVGDAIWLASYRRLKTCSFHRWLLGVFILVRYGLMVLPSVGVTILTAWRETILIFFNSQRVVASPGFPCPRMNDSRKSPPALDTLVAYGWTEASLVGATTTKVKRRPLVPEATEAKLAA